MRTEQTKAMSLIETGINTLIGYLVSFALWPVVAFFSDSVTYTVSGHFWIVAVFTVTSIIRGYLVRRFFEARIHLLSARIAVAVHGAQAKQGGPAKPCILCANGNDLPDGGECQGCGRVGYAPTGA